jgi:putative ABC transport system permease protein
MAVMPSNTLNKYILRNIAKRKARSLIIVLMIVVSVASLIGGMSALESVSQSVLASLEEAHAADVTVVIEGTAVDTLARLSSVDPRISEIEFRLLVHAGATIGSSSQNTNLFGLAGQPRVNKSFLKDGRWFSDANAHEVVLEQSLAKTTGAKVGDSIVVSARTGAATLAVVGIARDPQVAALGLGKPTLWMPLGTLQRLFDMESEVNLVYLIGRQAEDRDAIAQSAQDFLREQGVFVVSSIVHDRTSYVAQEVVQFGTFFSIVIAVLMLGITTLTVVNTLGRVLVESHNELALMKAMGALDRQLMALTITPVVLYGGIGTGIGVPLGVLLIRLLVSLYARIIQGTQLVTVISVTALVLSVFIGLGLPIIIVILASRFKRRVDLTSLLNPFSNIVASSAPCASVASGRALWCYITRSLGRRKTGTFIVTAGIVLVVGAFIGLRGFFAGIEELFVSQQNLLDYDLQIEFHEPIPQTVVEALESIEGVVHVEPKVSVYGQEVRAASSPKTMKVKVIGIPSSSQMRAFNYRVGEHFSAGESSPAEALVSTRVARELGLSIGDEITIANPNHAVRVRVKGIVVSIDNMGTVVYVPLPLVQTLTGNEGLISCALLKVRSGMFAQVTQVLKEQYGALGALYTWQYWLETNVNQLVLANVFISMVLVLLLVVVIISLVDVTAIRMLERRNEIAVLRALGGTRRQIAVILLGEQILVGLIGGLLAAGVGHGLLAVLIEWVSQFYFDVPFVFSPRLIIVSFSLSVATCLIGGSMPLGSALRVMPARLLHRHADFCE